MSDTTKLYSFQGQEPQLLPNEIRLSDGRSRTDSSTFTEEEVLDAGFTGPYEIPEYDQNTQKIYWNSETFSFIVEDISDEDLWREIRIKRNRLLSECDWTMVADSPEDLNFREWEMYRQRLRDIPNNYQNPKEVIWPISPENLSDDNFDQPRIYEDRLLRRVRDLEEIIKTLTSQPEQPIEGV